jgi:hypothetical protein
MSDSGFIWPDLVSWNTVASIVECSAARGSLNPGYREHRTGAGR